MPVRSTADDATQKWVNHLSSATAAIQAGVARVQTAPGQKAAAQSQFWLNRVTASADKWKRNVARVSLADWQNSMTTTGIPRIAQGAQQKQAKFTAFMSSFLPYLQQGVAKVDAMPKTNLEDSIARASAMIRHNAAFKRGA